MSNSKQLKAILNDIVIANNIWFTDSKYRDINSGQLKEFIKNVDVSKSPYIRNLHECEEFALSFLSDFRNFELKKFLEGDKDFSLNCPIGICAGVKFENKVESHTKNIALCTDGVFLIEPQSNRIKKFDKEQDEIFFIYM